MRLRIGSHRAQLVYGDGAIIVIEAGSGTAPQSVLVRVENADAHHEQALAAGARIVKPPTDYPYGERQYNAEDIGGHRWTFSQSIADIDPADWGGVLVAGSTEAERARARGSKIRARVAISVRIPSSPDQTDGPRFDAALLCHDPRPASSGSE